MEYRRLKDTKFEVGDRAFVKFMITEVDVREQKNGGHFMNIKCADQEVTLEGVKIFGVSQNMINTIVAGKVYEGAIDAKEYQGGISYIIYNIDAAKEEVVKDYISYETGYDTAKEELVAAINSLPDSLGKLVTRCIELTGNRFWLHSAGKSMHHSKVGGLVVHCNEVRKIADGIADGFGENVLLDRGLLATAAILHDIGKCLELTVDKNTGITDYDALCKLEGHISIGVRVIERAIADLSLAGIVVNDAHSRALRHCVLCHHGKLEYGSPVLPSTLEGVIVSHADMLSFELSVMKKNMDKVEIDECCSYFVGSERRNAIKLFD